MNSGPRLVSLESRLKVCTCVQSLDLGVVSLVLESGLGVWGLDLKDQNPDLECGVWTWCLEFGLGVHALSLESLVGIWTWILSMESRLRV